MFILGLFCVDENVVDGNRGKVGTVLFNLGCLCWYCLVLMKMFLLEIVVRWERGFSTWDVYGELNDNLIISCSDAQHILERLWLSLGLAASWAHGKRTK